MYNLSGNMKLREYNDKQNMDFEQLFAKYGIPLIKRTGTCDSKDSNIDIILQ